MVFTTWAANDSVSISLSGANLVATATVANTAAIRSVDVGSGKIYFEATFTTAANADTCVGIAVQTAPLTLVGANATKACVIYKGFPVYLNGSQYSPTVNIGTISSGSTVGVAVDFTAKLIWFRLGASGSWNATSGTANDPATGTGGIDFSVLTGRYYAIAGVWSVSDAITANFGASSFLGSAPSGFSSGWTASTFTPGTYTGWNPADAYATNIDPTRLIATIVVNQGAVRATDGYSAGKYYYEINSTVQASVGTGIGICNASAVLTSIYSTPTNAVVWYSAGNVYVNNVPTLTVTSFVAGDTLGMAVDLGSSKIWFRKGAAGGWNNDVIANQNPATGTGGISFSGISGTAFYPVFVTPIQADVGTANFGASSFIGTTPSGFTSGWPTIPIITYTTWDPTQKTANVTLTNSNLTATDTSTIASVRAVDQQTSGKFYWEITWTTINATNDLCGIVNGAALQGVGSFVSTLLNAATIGKTGAIFINNVSNGTITAITSGSIVCIAVDLTAKLIWFRVGAAGSWNATSGSANDPATGTGGKDLSSIAPAYQALYPCVGFAQSGDNATANFGASAFSGTVPSGYTSGWPSNLSPTNNIVATQVGASAWVTNTHAPFRVTQLGASVWVDNKAIAVYPLGVSAIPQVGTLIAIQPGIDIPLTGVQIGTAIGTPSVRIDESVSLTGVQTVAQTGSLTVEDDAFVPLTGLVSQALTGTPIPHVQYTIATGVQIGTAVGIPTVRLDETVALTGVQIAANIGTPTFEIDTNITPIGVESQALTGIPIPHVQYTIATGVQIGSAVGIPTVQVTFLNGVQSNTGIGTLIPHVDVTAIVSGVQIRAAIGQVVPFIQMPSVTAPHITGVQTNTGIGNLAFNSTIALHGVETVSGIGQPTVLIYVGEMQMADLHASQANATDDDLMITLRWSDTEGQSWNDPVGRSLGKIGDTLLNLQWQRLGMSRRGRVFELSWSSPTPTCLMGATVRMTDAST